MNLMSMHPPFRKCLITLPALIVGLAASTANASSDLSLSSSYLSEISTQMTTIESSNTGTSEVATDSIELSYEALKSVRDLMLTLYALVGDTTEIPDLAWQGTYSCGHSYTDSSGYEVYEYADYTRSYADGVEVEDEKSISVSAALVSGLSTSSEWGATADCSLSSISFDNYQ